MFDDSTESGKKVIELKHFYENCRKRIGSYAFYNLIEKCLIDVDLTPSEKEQIRQFDLENTLLKEIKGLAMLISRNKPADWNKFLDVVIK